MNVPELLNSLGSAYEDVTSTAQYRDEIAAKGQAKIDAASAALQSVRAEVETELREAQKAYEVAAQKQSSLQATLNAVLGKPADPRYRVG